MPDEMKDSSEQTPPVEGGAETSAPAPATAPPDAEDVAATAEQAPPAWPADKATVEDAGPVGRKITVEIDRKHIDAKFDEMFGELRTSALVPGFRIGHAPRRLLEKRFGKEVGQDVRNALVGEALRTAIEENKLQVLGEPKIELDKIVMPEEGNLIFTAEVEVEPAFELPDYQGIPVKEIRPEITDDLVEGAIQSVLRERGVMKPAEGPVRAGDELVVDYTCGGEGLEPVSHENVALSVVPQTLEDVPLEQFADTLTGAGLGQPVTLETTVPQGHPNEAWRGKTAAFAFTVKEIRRLELPEVNEALAAELGFGSVPEMRSEVRRSLVVRMGQEAQRAKELQVRRYLLDHTPLEVPASMAEHEAASLLRRRYVDLLQRGVPAEEIELHLEELQAQVGAQAQVELKLGFILRRIAEAENITVEEGEVNSRIAQMARMRGRRPERLRSELMSEGALETVESRIREDKTIARLLEVAKITPADEAGEEPPPAEAPAETPPEAPKADEPAAPAPPPAPAS